MTETITLTSNGTVSLELSYYGSLTVESPILGLFAPGGYGAQFICGVDQVVDSTFGTSGVGTVTGINSLLYNDLNSSSPLNIETVTAATPFTGTSTILAFNAIGFDNGEVLTLAKGVSSDFWQVASGDATLTAHATVAGAAGGNQFFPSSMYPWNWEGNQGFVVDPQGLIFDTTDNSYHSVNFFPTLNSTPPPGGSSFDGGFCNTVSGHNYLAISVYETVSPFNQLPSIIEETNQGTPSATYSYAFNDSVNVPGDVYNICGNTPDGFYFTNDNGIVEVNPSTASFTVYQFAAQDTVAASCLEVNLYRVGLFAATKDSVGNWWFSDSANQNYSVPSSLFNFAKSGGAAPTRTLHLSSIAGTHGTPLSVQGTYNYQNTVAPAALDIGYIQPDNSIIWVAPAGDTIGTSTPTGALTVVGATLA